MMQNLCLVEGGLLHVINATLPKANFVKIRPQSIAFLDLSNPRAVLEASLRKFSCMTVGDTICLSFNDKNYYLDVREVRPGEAACIIETDCEVDFEAPVDYVPPVRTPAVAQPYGGMATVKKEDKAAVSSRGATGGLRLSSSSDASKKPMSSENMRSARLLKYAAFQGTGQTLDGSASSSRPVDAATNGGTSSVDSKTPASFSGKGRRLR